MSRPITIPGGGRQLAPPTPPQSMGPHASYRPGLTAEQSLRLDIADLTTRLRALGETDLPTIPPELAVGASTHHAPDLTSPLSSHAPSSSFGSPFALPVSPPFCRPQSSLAVEAAYDTSFPASPCMPAPLFGTPKSPPPFAPRPYAFPPAAPSPASARPYVFPPAPPPPSLPHVASFELRPSAPARMAPIAESGPPPAPPMAVDDDCAWWCAACERHHDGDDEAAAIVVQPCGTLACRHALRMRLLNGGRALCPGCAGARAHTLKRAVALACLTAVELGQWSTKERLLNVRRGSV